MSLLPEETAELMLKKRTFFVVEATFYETYVLWQIWSKESDCCSQWRPSLENRVTWKQHSGWNVQVGEVAGKPVCASMLWNEIDGKFVLFWEGVSELVDFKLIRKWLETHFSGTWGHSSRKAFTNASNFHLCLQAIREAGRKGGGRSR